VYTRPKVVGPFFEPCTNRSYVHLADVNNPLKKCRKRLHT
jgi:hypothetical protein